MEPVLPAEASGSCYVPLDGEGVEGVDRSAVVTALVPLSVEVALGEGPEQPTAAARASSTTAVRGRRGYTARKLGGSFGLLNGLPPDICHIP